MTHGIALRAFRFLLERWTHDEAETRLRYDPPENCSVTVYERDGDAGRLVLREYNTVHWREA